MIILAYPYLHIFACSELDAIANTCTNQNVKIHYVLEKKPEGAFGLRRDVSLGLVTEDLLKKLGVRPGPDNMVFVCGPPAMMTAISGEKDKDDTQGEISGVLAHMGFKKEEVYKF